MSALRDAVQSIVAGRVLSEDEAFHAMGDVMSGTASEALIAAFLTALRVRGETTDELVGAARALRARVIPVVHDLPLVLDTCGTGGDGAQTFNVSTAVAFVCAAAGVPVAKHGNRAVSSRVGSADVLEALGARLDLGPDRIGACLAEVGFCFMFAPHHHGALRHAGPVRRELGFRTMMNLLGPLANPAGATHQLLGLFDGKRLAQIADVATRLGVRRGMVVHGPGGLDELGLDGPSEAAMIGTATIGVPTIDPRALGLAAGSPDALRGGDAATNAAIIRRIFAGERGAAADIVALNAGAALWVAEAAASIADGVARAHETLASGRAAATLDRFVAYTRAHGGPS